jgi:hypothetical protein
MRANCNCLARGHLGTAILKSEPWSVLTMENGAEASLRSVQYNAVKSCLWVVKRGRSIGLQISPPSV